MYNNVLYQILFNIFSYFYKLFIANETKVHVKFIPKIKYAKCSTLTKPQAAKFI